MNRRCVADDDEALKHKYAAAVDASWVVATEGWILARLTANTKGHRP
jgi:hypothetical protein